MDRTPSRLPASLCETPRRKRTWTPASVTNAYSTKRRRLSAPAAFDISEEFSSVNSISTGPTETTADRFISARADFTLPLNITPRSNRIARVFGLIEDKVLKYGDGQASSSSSSKEVSSFRHNFSKLLYKPSKISPTSAAANLGSRKQFILALDGPGVPSDPFAFPITWSKTNRIAVACGRDIYFQHLDTRSIKHLCKLSDKKYGRLMSIEWSVEQPSVISLGSTAGNVQVWDSLTCQKVIGWQDAEIESVAGMSWNKSLLAVGFDGGDIGFYDSRQATEMGRLTMHHSKVHGVKWCPNGNYLASSDQNGAVYIWDARAGKVLTNDNRMGGKFKHNAPVKALAWCPWKPDLLATGSTYPDGKIRIFSMKSTTSIPQPTHTIPLHTSVTSLQWSPHCKELLSTHGTSWHPAFASSHARPITHVSPTMNSITVHTYPSLRRIVSVTAHAGAVGHSCLSPDGTTVFTICPAEEAMKMWKIWSVRDKSIKKESSFDKFGIR